MQSKALVIAHRGVHATGAPENTMEAFALAVAAGADMIELDVRRSGDGQLAILHDHDRSDVALDSCSLDEFEGRTGFRPPLLDEVLGWAAGRIGLDVELKEDGYADQVAPLLAAFAAAGGELLVTSFLGPLLASLTQLAPSLTCGLLLEQADSDRPVERALAAGAGVILPEMAVVDEALLAEVAATSLEMIVWDFWAAQDAALLSDARVAGFITDDVPGALAARGGLVR